MVWWDRQVLWVFFFFFFFFLHWLGVWKGICGVFRGLCVAGYSRALVHFLAALLLRPFISNKTLPKPRNPLSRPASHTSLPLYRAFVRGTPSILSARKPKNPQSEASVLQNPPLAQLRSQRSSAVQSSSKSGSTIFSVWGVTAAVCT